MGDIKIDDLSEDELVALHHRIVSRLRELQQAKAQDAMGSIRIGAQVTFVTSSGEMVRGIVIRRNRKSVTVHDDRERQWTVAPQLLSVADERTDHVLLRNDIVLPEGVVAFIKK